MLNQIPAELLINNTGKVENQAVNVIADTVNIRLIGQGVYHQQTERSRLARSSESKAAKCWSLRVASSTS